MVFVLKYLCFGTCLLSTIILIPRLHERGRQYHCNPKRWLFQFIILLTNVENKVSYKDSIMLRTDSTHEYPITLLNNYIMFFDWLIDYN